MAANERLYSDVSSGYSPMQLDSRLADQYFESLRRRPKVDPEKNLMVAVLEDAVSCVQKNVLATTDREKRVREEAEDWILDDNDQPLFSYRNVCETLDLDFQRLRDGLMEWKRRKLEEHSKEQRSARLN